MSPLLNAVQPLLGLLPSPIPRRQRRLTGQRALVDGIPYDMPINSEDSPVLMAAFPISRRAAAAVMPSKELHPINVGFGKSLLLVTVVNYLATDIGAYIEYSLAIVCTHGRRPAPPLLPMIFQKTFGLGQYVVDLPVSSEISVKGGKGIWGMPKHQASLDFVVTDSTVSAAYEDDGRPACFVEIERPAPAGLPLKLAAVNYCAFRGMLMKSSIYFEAKADIALGRSARARLVLGDTDAVAPLRTLKIASKPIFTAYLPHTHGVLDDHVEAWFLTADSAEDARSLHKGDPLESVVGLSLSEEWPPAPTRSTVGQEGAP